MWIAVTGAQGSGKSTIARALVSQLGEQGVAAEAVEGIGEYVGSLKFPLGEAATRDTVIAFLLEHVRRERHAPPATAVFDRCLIDLLAYAIIQLDEADPVRQLVVELAQMSMPRFSYAFMTVIPLNRVDASSRHESAAFRNRVERTLHLAASTCETKLILLQGSGEERLTLALSVILG